MHSFGKSVDERAFVAHLSAEAQELFHARGFHALLGSQLLHFRRAALLFDRQTRPQVLEQHFDGSVRPLRVGQHCAQLEPDELQRSGGFDVGLGISGQSLVALRLLERMGELLRVVASVFLFLLAKWLHILQDVGPCRFYLRLRQSGDGLGRAQGNGEGEKAKGFDGDSFQLEPPLDFGLAVGMA